MFVKTLNIPIYDLKLIVVIDDCAWTIYDEPFVPDNIIYLLLRSGEMDYGTIVHELMHVISGVCKLRGLEMDHENDESLAYLQGWAGDKVFKARDIFLNKNKRRV